MRRDRIAWAANEAAWDEAVVNVGMTSGSPTRSRPSNGTAYHASSCPPVFATKRRLTALLLAPLDVAGERFQAPRVLPRPHADEHLLDDAPSQWNSMRHRLKRWQGQFPFGGAQPRALNRHRPAAEHDLARHDAGSTGVPTWLMGVPRSAGGRAILLEHRGEHAKARAHSQLAHFDSYWHISGRGPDEGLDPQVLLQRLQEEVRSVRSVCDLCVDTRHCHGADAEMIHQEDQRPLLIAICFLASANCSSRAFRRRRSRSFSISSCAVVECGTRSCSAVPARVKRFFSVSLAVQLLHPPLK